MHTEWKEKDRKGDLIAKKEGTDRDGKAGASGEGGAVRLEGADIERKRTHRRHYGDKKNGGAKADRSGQSGQSGHLKGQGVDRQWTGVWTAERHFLSIRIPACI